MSLKSVSGTARYTETAATFYQTLRRHQPDESVFFIPEGSITLAPLYLPPIPHGLSWD
jgi:hypothetical protein